MLTETPTAESLIEQIRQHHAKGGGSALVRESQEKWRFRLSLYEPTGQGEMGEPVWAFVRDAATDINSRTWATVLNSGAGVAGRGLHGLTVSSEAWRRWNAARSTGATT